MFQSSEPPGMMWALVSSVGTAVPFTLLGGEPGHGERQRGKGLWAGYQNGVGHGALHHLLHSLLQFHATPSGNRGVCHRDGLQEGWDAAPLCCVFWQLVCPW